MVMYLTCFQEGDTTYRSIGNEASVVALFRAPGDFKCLIQNYQFWDMFTSPRHSLLSQRCWQGREAQISRNPRKKNTRDVVNIELCPRTSIELTVRRRANDVWLIDVPIVGTGGFVGPIVPVAMTPGKNVLVCAIAV